MNTTTLKEKVYINVYAVALTCLIQKQSLSLGQVGQAFGMLLPSKTLKRLLIKALA